MHQPRRFWLHLLALCAALIAAPWAQAVSLSPRGTGQVLLYPYYTVNGGQSTLLSVVNTTNKAKALRVVFRESHNGRQVLGFNVYLSLYDVWTGVVFPLGDGAANLLTDDHSCTVPALRDNIYLPTLPDGRHYATFRNYGYIGDGGPAGVARTREGTVEVIELGEVVDQSPTWVAITHRFGAPANCARVQGAWAPGGYWSSNPDTDIQAPGGGLYGSLSVVNPAQGTIFEAAASALEGFSRYAQHTAPSSAHPDLGDARSSPAGAATPYADAEVSTNAGLVRAHYVGADRTVDAVSAVLMADSLANEYVIEPASGANTDWLLSFPTKRFYTDTALTTAALPPFDELFGEEFAGKSCSVFDLSTFNREEGVILQPWNNYFFSAPMPVLCYSTNVMTFDSTGGYGEGSISASLGSHLSYRMGVAAFNSGHMRLNFDDIRQPHALRADANGVQFHGQPVIGFDAVKYANARGASAAPANYSAIVPHRSTVKCTGGAAGCP